jgi:hypothetical protein
MYMTTSSILHLKILDKELTAIKMMWQTSITTIRKD